ncbi:poly(A) polymerase, partial [Campylobacter jejuni]
NHIFSKENHYLIATLSNPLFIDIKKDLKSNFKELEENLTSFNKKLFK